MPDGRAALGHVFYKHCRQHDLNSRLPKKIASGFFCGNGAASCTHSARRPWCAGPWRSRPWCVRVRVAGGPGCLTCAGTGECSTTQNARCGNAWQGLRAGLGLPPATMDSLAACRDKCHSTPGCTGNAPLCRWLWLWLYLPVCRPRTPLPARTLSSSTGSPLLRSIRTLPLPQSLFLLFLCLSPSLCPLSSVYSSPRPPLSSITPPFHAYACSTAPSVAVWQSY